MPRARTSHEIIEHLAAEMFAEVESPHVRYRDVGLIVQDRYRRLARWHLRKIADAKRSWSRRPTSSPPDLDSGRQVVPAGGAVSLPPNTLREEK